MAEMFLSYGVEGPDRTAESNRYNCVLDALEFDVQYIPFYCLYT